MISPPLIVGLELSKQSTPSPSFSDTRHSSSSGLASSLQTTPEEPFRRIVQFVNRFHEPSLNTTPSSELLWIKHRANRASENWKEIPAPALFSTTQSNTEGRE